MNKYRINLTEGAGYSGPYINKFSAGFDKIEFFVDKSFSEDCTYAVIYSVCGDVGMTTDSDGNVAVSIDSDTGKTVLTWTIGREITCDSGVVIYQVVVYHTDAEGKSDAVWYSPQGRIVVGESIDTTEYETASIAAEPSLVSQLISKTNKLWAGNQDHQTRIDILEQLQQVSERRIDDMGREFSAHGGDKIIHITADERDEASHYLGLCAVNGLLDISPEEAEETNTLLTEVVSLRTNLRIAFMTGAHSVNPGPYNKLKLLSTYGICDYIINGGGLAPHDRPLTLAEIVEISRSSGSEILHLRGDEFLGRDTWMNVFSGGIESYYYIDDIKKNVRIVVLDTQYMDGVQLNWLMKDALKPPSKRPVIIFSHRNLMNFTLGNEDEPLFKRIFKTAQDGGVISMSGELLFDGSFINNIYSSTSFDGYLEIIAVVHGDCIMDTCENDLSLNFCNIGVADDFVDGHARALFETTKVEMHSDVSKISQIINVEGAKIDDVSIDGSNVIELTPTSDCIESYIVPDEYDISDVKGYVVIETNIRVGDQATDGSFLISTDMSYQISKRISISDLVAAADADGWTKVTVVICKKAGDINYGSYNTYINGVSYSNWHNGFLGETTDGVDVCTEIRLTAEGLTSESQLYFGRTRVYVSQDMPSDTLIREGLAYAVFRYGGKLYNIGYEQELLKEINGDKGCYDVFCIDTYMQTIYCRRFGYGLSREMMWTIPDFLFEMEV